VILVSTKVPGWGGSRLGVIVLFTRAPLGKEANVVTFGSNEDGELGRCLGVKRQQQVTETFDLLVHDMCMLPVGHTITEVQDMFWEPLPSRCKPFLDQWLVAVVLAFRHIIVETLDLLT